MSDDITVDVTRQNMPVANAQGLALQLDNMSQQEAAYYGGSGPYMRFNGLFSFVPDIVTLLQDDLLIDTKNIDPMTNFKKQYRIINLPEHFPDNHVEVVADLMRGK